MFAQYGAHVTGRFYVNIGGRLHLDPPGSRCTQSTRSSVILVHRTRCTRFIVASSSPRRRRVAMSSPHRRRRSSSPLSSPPPPSSPVLSVSSCVDAAAEPVDLERWRLHILGALKCLQIGRARLRKSRLRAREGQGEPSRFEAAWGQRALARASLLPRRGFRAARERAVVVWSPETKARS